MSIENVSRAVDLMDGNPKIKRTHLPDPFHAILAHLDDDLEQFRPSAQQLGEQSSFTIFSAVITGHKIKIREMAEQNPYQLNQRNRAGWTPLMYAMANGCSDACPILLEHGADYRYVNYEGMTALGLGASFGHRGTVAAFLKHVRMVCGVNELIAVVNAKDAHGRTGLHYAAASQQWETLQVLLKNHADPNMPDNRRNTALHEAVRADHDMTIRILYEHGAVMDTANDDGETPRTLLKPRKRYLLEDTVDEDFSSGTSSGSDDETTTSVSSAMEKL